MNSVLPAAALPVLVLLGCTGESAAEEASAGPRTPSGDSGHGTGGEGAGTGGSDAVTDSGDGGGGFDTGGEDTGQTVPGLPEYCSGGSALADCDPERHLDPFWEFSGDIPLETPAGGMLSLPFTVRASEVDGGQLSMTTIENAFIDERSFRLWYSEAPGGPPLATDTACLRFYRQARGGTYWTQNPAHSQNDSFCFLGTEERVLYVNFEVCPVNDEGICIGEREGGYRFDLRRNYRAY